MKPQRIVPKADDAVELISRLRVRERSEGNLRVIFPDESVNSVDTLLECYLARNDRSTGQELAMTTDDMTAHARQVLVELEERNASQGFLTAKELKQVRQALRGPSAAARFRAQLRSRIRPKHMVAAASMTVTLLAASYGLPAAFHALSADPAPPSVASAPLVPGEQQPLTKDEMDKVTELFGPWTTIPVSEQSPDSKNPALLLLKQNGATAASQKYTVPFSEGQWARDTSVNISGVPAVNGQIVRIVSTQDQPFIVHVGQPFMFERTPGQIFLVDSTGNVWKIDEAGATALRHEL